MQLAEFEALLNSQERPVVLLEGKREIPENYRQLATKFGIWVARTFPHTRFRSGNADGADRAFCDGIAAVAPGRLEIITPYQGHKKQSRYATAVYVSAESLATVDEEQMIYQTGEASPQYQAMLGSSHKALKAKSRYLIRDTMKVVGCAKEIHPPVVGIFYVNPDEPESGGTGHTIRVCLQHGVPVVTQHSWEKWIDQPSRYIR